MNDGLIDAFRHNSWATREVLRVCRDLNEDQLNATAAGTYGSLIGTLWHVISSEAGYYARLSGKEPGWDRRARQAPDVDELIARNDNLAERWDAFLSSPFDAERTFVILWKDGHDYDVPAGVVLAQVLHHGNEHRAHACTVLTTIGVTTPLLGLWDWAEATGRAKPGTA
jgi:uncharacterized damage-inducible protein DinB